VNVIELFAKDTAVTIGVVAAEVLNWHAEAIVFEHV
jgi:hypothetical protein